MAQGGGTVARALAVAMLGLVLGLMAAQAAPPVDPSMGETEVTRLYRLLARINGEPLPHAARDPYPRKGDEAGATDGATAKTVFPAARPVICFPRGVGRFDAGAWAERPHDFRSASQALDQLALDLKQARSASASGTSAPVIAIRVIGFADPTASATRRDPDDDNFDLSLDRAVAIRDALRRRLPSSGFSFEAEGRGPYHTRPEHPGAAESSVEQSGARDESCAPFERADAAGARESAGIDPAQRKYVASQRRVEIEIRNAALTHAGHRLTRDALARPEFNDVRLRLFPAGTMPARTLSEELDFIPGGLPEACAPAKRPGELGLLGPRSSGWVRQSAVDDGPEQPTSRLDANDGGIALRLDVYEVWRTTGGKTEKGARLALSLARQTGFGDAAIVAGADAPGSYARGLGVPGYWAAHQRIANLLGRAASRIAGCLETLKPGKAAGQTPIWKAIPSDPPGFANWSAAFATDERRAAWRDRLVVRLPKDLDGILLHAHRLDRHFRFFDLAPGMSLQLRPAGFDLVSRFAGPADSTPFDLKADPIEPCAPVPVPRKSGLGSSRLDDPRRLVVGHPLDAFFGAGTEGLCGRDEATPTLAQVAGCQRNAAGGYGRPKDENDACTRQFTPLRSVTAVADMLRLGPVRVFSAERTSAPDSAIGANDVAVLHDACAAVGDAICNPLAWLLSRAPNPPTAQERAFVEAFRRSFAEALNATTAEAAEAGKPQPVDTFERVSKEALEHALREAARISPQEAAPQGQSNFGSVPLLVVAPDQAQLDSWRSARRFNPDPPGSDGGRLSIPFTPCVGAMRCGYLTGNLSLVAGIAVQAGGRAQPVGLGARVVHLAPEAVSAACFETATGPVAGMWAGTGKLAQPLEIDLAGPDRKPLVDPRSLLVARRDCRLLGLFLTHGSRIQWSR